MVSILDFESSGLSLTLGRTSMHVGVELVKEAKVHTLKSEFEVIRMNCGDSIDDFTMKLTTIVTDTIR